MGTDIHLGIEVRKDGRWQPATLLHPTWDEGGYKYFEDYNFFVRNYSLFSMLADVRNNYDFEPVAPQRGLPSDLSPELQAIVDGSVSGAEFGTGGDLGDHSFTWLTLKELQDYDWEQTTRFPYKTDSVTYRECAGDFYTHFMPALAKLGAPEDVRIVFGFDN